MDPPPREPLVEPLDWRGSALDLFRRISRGRHPFLLLSGTASSPRGRWTLMGCDPFRTWSAQAGAGKDDPFTTVGRLLSRYPTAETGGLPFVGGLVASIWNLVLEVVGFAAVHRTSQGRALVAVLIPIILCCLCGLILSVLFGAVLYQFIQQFGDMRWAVR